MCSRPIKVSKYYRLATRYLCETENVSVVVDSVHKQLSVFCGGNVREKITINADKSKYPRISFRDPNVYCMFSTSSSDGFRLNFDEKEEKEEFVRMMQLMGYLTDTESPMSNGSSQKSLTSSSGSIRMIKTEIDRVYSNSQGTERDPMTRTTSYHSCSQPIPRSHPPRLPYRPTPSPRRSIIKRPLESSQSSQSSSISSSQNSMSSSQQRFYEATKRVNIPCETSEKSTQTDDLIDMLIENEEFTGKLLNHLMNDDGFLELVESFNEQIENMESEEKEKLLEETEPTSQFDRKPPPIRSTTSEKETD